MKLYVYCVAAGLDTLNGSIIGVTGRPVRLLKIDDFSLVVSDCEVGSLPVTRDAGLAHAAVVRSVMDQATPLPFRFGMLATEPQLQRFITSNKPPLSEKLAHVRGCVEMNLKIMWNSKANDAAPHDGEPAGPGTEFLKQKRRELLGDEHRTAQIVQLSDILRDPLSGLIKDEHITLRPSETVVLAAVAHLIESPGIEQYRKQVAELLNNRPDLRVMLSGPWPPYSFANIELEFNARFGVS